MYRILIEIILSLKIMSFHKFILSKNQELEKKKINIKIDENIIDFVDKTYFNFVEKIIYINLEEREDRRKSIEYELRFINPDKIIRFNAIKEESGIIGCVKSHIAVLEMAIQNNWKNCLILEDDMLWKNFNSNYPVLEKLIENNYDVIILGGIYLQYNKVTLKCKHAVTTTAYLINNSYYSKLLKNFKEGLELRLKFDLKDNTYNLDEYWNKLIRLDNWYVVVPSLCIQKSDFSNIQNKFRDKLNLFI